MKLMFPFFLSLILAGRAAASGAQPRAAPANRPFV